MAGLRKHFESCGHTGYGQYCHKCNPWPERSPKEQLKKLNDKNLTAKKEREKLKRKVAKIAKQGEDNKLRIEQKGRIDSSGSKRKRSKNPKRTSVQGGQFKKRKTPKQIF